MDPITTTLTQALNHLSGLSPELATEAQRLRDILTAPPRIVVVGRLKSGKSTLVNALIGAPVAETAALEATNVVTIYQYGAPDRAEATLTNGQRLPIPLQRGTTTQLPAPAHDISYIHRWMPTAAIKDFTLIDTPGLATLTIENETRTRRVLIDGYAQTRHMSAEADAAIFLFDSTPRADETTFLNELGFTPLNTLGVLSRADSFGEGALGHRDPLDHAHEHAHTLAKQLKNTVFTVVPVAGLLAESSHTGAITEHEARSLANLADTSPLDLIRLTGFICPIGTATSTDTSPTRETCRHLIQLLGEYGLFHARNIARGGASALNDWAIDKSGITALRQLLVTRLGNIATAHRAGRIIADIENLTYKTHARDQVLNLLSTMRNDAHLLPAFLLHHLKSVQETNPHSSLIPELTQLITGDSPQAKLGLPHTATPHKITSTAQQKLHWAQMESLAAHSAAEDAALITITRAYNELQGG